MSLYFKRFNHHERYMDLLNELDAEEMVLFTRKFKRSFQKNSNARKGKASNQKASELMRFKCRKPVHIKLDCPQEEKEGEMCTLG